MPTIKRKDWRIVKIRKKTKSNPNLLRKRTKRRTTKLA